MQETENENLKKIKKEKVYKTLIKKVNEAIYKRIPDFENNIIISPDEIKSKKNWELTRLLLLKDAFDLSQTFVKPHDEITSPPIENEISSELRTLRKENQNLHNKINEIENRLEELDKNFTYINKLFLESSHEDIIRIKNQTKMKSKDKEIENLPEDKVIDLIINFLENKKSEIVYPSDIAYEYGLDPRRVFEICRKLKERGIIENV
ncbi:MAG: hypothetical protein EU549_05370 [Promethearchaeota archaeon]|nr:MAG: hypothetical protein EU549_05370 [Candidatus Lokiarchaeota archaeon]